MNVIMPVDTGTDPSTTRGESDVCLSMHHRNMGRRKQLDATQ